MKNQKPHNIVPNNINAFKENLGQQEEPGPCMHEKKGS